MGFTTIDLFSQLPFSTSDRGPFIGLVQTSPGGHQVLNNNGMKYLLGWNSDRELPASWWFCWLADSLETGAGSHMDFLSCPRPQGTRFNEEFTSLTPIHPTPPQRNNVPFTACNQYRLVEIYQFSSSLNDPPLFVSLKIPFPRNNPGHFWSDPDSPG